MITTIRMHKKVSDAADKDVYKRQLYNYARISVNGEYWGVYLALEAVEESFALRNYGTHYGNLSKPCLLYPSRSRMMVSR